MATLVNAEAAVASGADIPLPVGSNWEPGDFRVVKISRSSGGGVGATPAGWNLVYSGTADAVSRFTALYTRTLQAGDTDDSVSRSGGSGGWAYMGITLRGWDPEKALIWDQDGGSDSGGVSTAPSLNVPGAGTLLTFHEATVLNNEAQGGPLNPPSGMTLEASSYSDGPMGYNLVLASDQVTAGSTGARATTFANTVGGWSGMSLFIEDVSGGGDPDPEPGGGTPTIISEQVDSTNGGATSHVFAGVQTDDLIVCIGTRAYGESPGEALAYSGGSGILTEVGVALGEVPAAAGYQNVMMRGWALRATSSGTFTVTQPASAANLTALFAAHLRGAADPINSVENFTRQGTSSSSLSVGPVEGPAGALAYGAWQGIDWNAQPAYSPPPQMTLVGRSGESFSELMAAGEVLAVEGDNGMRAATVGDADSSSAAKLFVIPGIAAPEPSGPEPGRMLLAGG